MGNLSLPKAGTGTLPRGLLDMLRFRHPGECGRRLNLPVAPPISKRAEPAWGLLGYLKPLAEVANIAHEGVTRSLE